MSIQEIIGEAIGEGSMCWSEIPKGVFESDRASKIVTQATAKLKALMLECVPKEKEVGEMRYGGCNPDEDRGWNQALTDIKQKVGLL